MGHFLYHFLVEDGFIEENQGVADDKPEKHSVENTHARVEQEENDT